MSRESKETERQDRGSGEMCREELSLACSRMQRAQEKREKRHRTSGYRDETGGTCCVKRWICC